MSVVRDPAFWRRFSAAVHMDEEAQAGNGTRPELKHSYVDSHSLCVQPSEEPRSVADQEKQEEGPQPQPQPPSPPGGPLQETPPPMSFSRPFHAPAHPQSRSVSPYPNPPSPTPSSQFPPPRPARLRSQSSSYPLISPPLLRSANRLSSNTLYSEATPCSTPPVSSPQSEYPFPTTPDETSYPTPIPPSAHPSLTPQARPRPQKTEKQARPIYMRRNSSALTLGLSGRPRSRGFQFWTSVTADPSNRESWLEEQRRKKSKRTYMCWGFWLVVMALVAGVVVTVLLLKGKGII